MRLSGRFIENFDIPTDQYPQRPEDLIRLLKSWNSLTGRSESAPDVLHYMITRRKKENGKSSAVMAVEIYRGGFHSSPTTISRHLDGDP